mgnify:FL=1
MKLKAILFDLDDTLYLERDFVKSGFRAVARWLQQENGLPEKETFTRLWSLFTSGERGDLFDRLLGDDPKKKALVNDLVSVYREHEPKISLLPGMKKCLLQLRKNFKLGLVTDGHEHVQKQKIAVLNLDDIFHAVIMTDELGHNNWKPSTVPFIRICQKLDIEPHEAIYIADNPQKDFKGPNQLGMSSIRFRLQNGEHYHRKPVSPDYAPTTIVNGRAQLLEELIKHYG